MNPYEEELIEQELEQSLIDGKRKGIAIVGLFVLVVTMYFYGLVYVAHSMVKAVEEHFKVEKLENDSF